MIDDDKNLDKNLTRLMIGGAVLSSALIIACVYDAGYQSGVRQTQPTVVHGNLTINNNSNNLNQPSPVEK